MNMENLLAELKKCRDCSKMVQSRIEVLKKDTPVLFEVPKNKDLIEYIFVGMAPGRLAKIMKTHTIKPFAHGSGKILNSIIEDLKINKIIKTKNCIHSWQSGI